MAYSRPYTVLEKLTVRKHSSVISDRPCSAILKMRPCRSPSCWNSVKVSWKSSRLAEPCTVHPCRSLFFFRIIVPRMARFGSLPNQSKFYQIATSVILVFLFFQLAKLQLQLVLSVFLKEKKVEPFSQPKSQHARTRHMIWGQRHPREAHPSPPPQPPHKKTILISSHHQWFTIKMDSEALATKRENIGAVNGERRLNMMRDWARSSKWPPL